MRTDAGPSPARMLEVYLNDHRAGATAGLALARRLHRANRETAFGGELASIASDIAADVRALDQVMSALGVRRNVFKRLLALAGELVTRLKPTGMRSGSAPLARLLALEALLMGVRGKAMLWKTLGIGELAGAVRSPVDVDELSRRVSSQLDLLAGLHARAAAELFPVAGDVPPSATLGG